MRIFLIAVAPLLACGCAMPKHSNTLVFGTSTKVALDISADPTGQMGVTLGYKRQEAVWMPLLANTGGNQPAQCENTPGKSGCKFVGVGSENGAAGKDAYDTYSVLATLSGDVNAGAKPPSATGGIAQYFATGLAARLLAAVGGAALVNTSQNSQTPSAQSVAAAVGATDPELKARVSSLLKTRNNAIEAFVKSCSDGQNLKTNWADFFKNTENKKAIFDARGAVSEDQIKGVEKLIKLVSNAENVGELKEYLGEYWDEGFSAVAGKSCK